MPASRSERVAPAPKRYTVRLGFDSQEDAETWFSNAARAGVVGGAAGLRHRELCDEIPAGAEVPMIVDVGGPDAGSPRAWVVEPPPSPSPS